MQTKLNQLIECTNRGAYNSQPCGWTEFLVFVNELIGFAIYIATLITVLGFVYAGWLFLTSQGNPSAKEKAKGVLMSCVLGIIFILTAWLIVQFIVSNLGLNPNYSAVEIKK